MTASRILLVRHGESEGNVANVWTSSHVGYPLTERGHEQARAAGETFLDRGVTALYASHIPRAQQTAEEVGAVLGLPVRTLDGIGEFGVGVHEGVHDDDVAPVAAEVFGRWMGEGDLTAAFEFLTGAIPSGLSALLLANRAKYQDDSMKVSKVSVSRRAGPSRKAPNRPPFAAHSRNSPGAWTRAISAPATR